MDSGVTLASFFIRSNFESAEDAAIHVTNASKLRIVQKSLPEFVAPGSNAVRPFADLCFGSKHGSGDIADSQARNQTPKSVISLQSPKKRDHMPATPHREGSTLVDRRHEAGGETPLSGSAIPRQILEADANRDSIIRGLVASSMGTAARGVGRIALSLRKTEKLTRSVDASSSSLIQVLGELAEAIAGMDGIGTGVAATMVEETVPDFEGPSLDASGSKETEAASIPSTSTPQKLA